MNEETGCCCIIVTPSYCSLKMVLRWKKVELPQSRTRDKAKVADLTEQDRGGIFETEAILYDDQDQTGPCPC